MASLTPTLPAWPTAPDEALVNHALRLLATAEVAEAEAAARAHERLAAWCRRSAAHGLAHAEAARRWQALSGAAAGLRDQWPDPIEAAARTVTAAPATSRRGLLGLAIVGVAGLVGGNAWWQWHAAQPLYAQAWRTRTAELLRVTLPDRALVAANGSRAGTEVMLSAQTALRAALYRDRREIELGEGEARFDVIADATRPLIVRTRAGRVEVVGTAFTVADRGGVLTVAVEHGRVRVYPRPAASEGSSDAGAFIALGRGEVVTLREGQAPGPVQRVAAGDVGAWRSGWLVFDDVPLAEALPAINAFRRTPLALAEGPGGAQVGRLRLTARFRAADEQVLVSALAAVLPLRAELRADGRVVLRPRP